MEIHIRLNPYGFSGCAPNSRYHFPTCTSPRILGLTLLPFTLARRQFTLSIFGVFHKLRTGSCQWAVGSDGSDKDSSLTTALNDTRQYGLDGSETCSAALSGMSSVFHNREWEKANDRDWWWSLWPEKEWVTLKYAHKWAGKYEIVLANALVTSDNNRHVANFYFLGWKTLEMAGK